MKAEIKFDGTLEQFKKFTRHYSAESQVQATIIVTVAAKELTLEDKARACALKYPGAKIQAIKAVRECTNWDLFKAKEFVETLPGFAKAYP